MSDISLEVEQGEIITLFGPSGCGKTTLLRLVAGLEMLQTGAVSLGNTPLASASLNIPPECRPIGFVFQDYVLFPHLTVLENIMFGLKDHPKSKAKELALTRVESLRLSGLEKRYPHQLSGGQQQRVALARALARNPAAMLFDEPLASVDAGLRQHLQEEIRATLKADNVATLFVTHDPQEAIIMGDRIVILKEGHVAEIATPEQLYAKPSSLEGALLFPGNQVLDARMSESALETSFGVCAVPQHLNTSQQTLPKEALLSLVIAQDALNVEPASSGPITVYDSRYAGPEWVHYLRHLETDETIRVQSAKPLALGSPVRTALQAEKIRFITKKG